MVIYLEVCRREGVQVAPLEGERVTIGRDASNDVSMPSDPRVSRLHAVLERFPAGWCVRDLGSRNGTYVNGQRVSSDRPLFTGDEIRVGSTRLVYRITGSSEIRDATLGAVPPPQLTPRERDVLNALLRPAMGSSTFTEPASTAHIAAALFVTEAAVKQHLLRLYDKFGIPEGPGRRLRLANAAVERGAVSLTNLKPDQ